MPFRPVVDGELHLGLPMTLIGVAAPTRCLTAPTQCRAVFYGSRRRQSMEWSDSWRGAFRIELRAEAIGLAWHGWPVLPGTYPAGSQSGARPGAAGSTQTVRCRCTATGRSASAPSPSRSPRGGRAVRTACSLPPGHVIDAIEVSADLGRGPPGRCAPSACRCRSSPPRTTDGCSSSSPASRCGPIWWTTTTSATTARASTSRCRRRRSSTVSCTGGSSRRSAAGNCPKSRHRAGRARRSHPDAFAVRGQRSAAGRRRAVG